MKKMFFVFMACFFLFGCNKKKGDENISLIEINEAKTYEEEKVEEQFIEEIPAIISKEIKIEEGDIMEYNYADGNGTILYEFIENNKRITIRKHISRFQIYLSGKITAFSKPYMNSDKLFSLNDGDYINTLETAYVIDLSDGSKSSWVKIQISDNRIGWLDMDDARDPYRNGYGAFLEKIITKDKEWTIIKLVAGLSFYETLDVRDRPGFTDSTVLYKIMNENNQQLSVNFFAISKEKDSIYYDNIKYIGGFDNFTDHWLKIEDDTGRSGWIFGGFCHSFKGGPKYDTPEEHIKFMFNLP
jgi:hypothetical protein